jgi:hypothetical protein
MIKKIFFLMTFFYGLLYAQDDPVKGLDVNMNITVIDYYNYKVTINSTPNTYYTCHLESVKDGKVMFQMDSSFSDYQWHSIIDLDNDGYKELLLSVYEGTSPYTYNSIYIFDVRKGAKPVCQVFNANLDTTIKEEPKLRIYNRISPSVLGLGYNWLMEYKNGMLKFFEAGEAPWKKMVKPDEASILDNLNQYEDFSEKCNDFSYRSFFKAYLIQAQIYGDNEAALKFIDKYYTCPDKKNAKQQIIDESAESFEWITNSANYKYAE